jgi:CheY-like chemotaxis protein
MAKILIIDDETAVLRLVAQMLDLEGHEVQIADHGETGIQLAIQSRPDLVICDVSMPSMDGFQVIEALRAVETTRTIPVVMITGVRDSALIERIEKAGVAGVLFKPFTHDRLFAVIDRCLRASPRQE